MSQHRKNNNRGSNKARPIASTGLAGAAMVGIGFLLAAPPGAPGPINTSIQLTTFDVPLAPATGDQWWMDLFGGGAAPAAAAT